MQRSTRRVNKPTWFGFAGSVEMLEPDVTRSVFEQNWMQGWHYGKGLIYLRPIFRLTKLAFLKARAVHFIVHRNAVTHSGQRRGEHSAQRRGRERGTEEWERGRGEICKRKWEHQFDLLVTTGIRWLRSSFFAACEEAQIAGCDLPFSLQSWSGRIDTWNIISAFLDCFRAFQRQIFGS